MLATFSSSTSSVFGQGATRWAVLGLGLAIVLGLAFREHSAVIEAFLVSFDARSEAIFSSAFTFLAIFWAAMLTIWSLMKSRATRYIERLTDTQAFRGFIRDLEIRLLFGIAVIVASFLMYIINMPLSSDVAVWLLGGWLYLWFSSLLLLIDSLVSARVVLD